MKYLFYETLQVAKVLLRTPETEKLLSLVTPENTEKSYDATLVGNRDQYGTMSSPAERDKEKYDKSLARDVEGNFNEDDLRLSYRALKKLCSEPPSGLRGFEAVGF